MPDTFKDQLKRLLQPMFYADAQHGNALDIFTSGLGDTFQVVEDYASDTDDGKPGYSLWVDLDRAPDEVLPWLAQLVGVRTIVGLTPAQLREQIGSLGNWSRGTVHALETAPKYLLRNGKGVIVTERDTSAYHLEVQINKDDMPIEDIATTNLWTNGRFETNTTGWNIHGSSATLARTTEMSKFGNASGRLSADISGGVGVAGNSGFVPGITAGLPHSFAVYTRTKQGVRPVQMRVQWYDGAFAQVGVTSFSNLLVPPTDDFYRFKLENITAPASAVYTYFDIGMQGSGAVGDAIWIDGMQIEQQKESLPYVETNGSTQSSAGQGLVLKALLTQKPAGLVMNFVIYEGQKAFTVRDSPVRGPVPDALRLVV